MSSDIASWHEEKTLPARLTLATGSPWRVSLRRMVDRDALRDVLPMLVGIAPFAVVIGVSLSQLEMTPWLGLLASALMYGGSAQLAATNLIVGAADIATILATVAVVNARLLMYGAALEPRFRDQPWWFRWLAPQFIVDQTYALATSRSELKGDPVRFRRYWFTIGGAISAVWLGVIGVSLIGGARIDSESALMIAAPALFVGMLVPRLTNLRTISTALTAGIVSSAGAVLPNGLGLLVGILAGMAVAAAVDRRQS